MADEKVVTVGVTDYDEETGLVSFEVDEDGKDKLVQYGFKYILMLAVFDIDEDEVFNILEAHKEKLIKETLQQSYDYWHEGSPV